MATVILVGAGATLAEALPARPRRSFRPPLDATFFDLASRARLVGGDVVKQYMEQHFGIDPFQGYKMESIFNYVYSDVFATPRPTGALDAYWALLQMYSAAIARTTNRLRGTTREGIGSVLRTLWGIDRDISFITFNQDLVIEKALEAASSTAKYAEIPWNIFTCYRRDFAAFLYPTQGATFRARGERDRPDPSLQILKLHGSLNWVWRAPTREDARNSIPRPGTDIYCLTGQGVEGDLELDEEETEKYLLPLVVPPIYEKGPQYRGFLAPLWAAARRALVSADRLIVFGYSFPSADFSARSLLRGAFHQSTKLGDVTVVDINPSVASLLADFLELRACSWFQNVPSYKSGQTSDN
jgi:hypothetical protein